MKFGSHLTKDKRAKDDKRGSIPVSGAFLSIEEDANFSLTVEDHTYHFQVHIGDLEKVIRISLTLMEK